LRDQYLTTYRLMRTGRKPIYYRFVLDDRDGTENLGGMSLANDNEAIDFAVCIIRDLERDGGQPARCRMLIAEGERTIGSIPLELGDNSNQRKSG
jgi:hypothetical protein